MGLAGRSLNHDRSSDKGRRANEMSDLGEGRVVAMTSKRINPNFGVFGCVNPDFLGKSYPAPARIAGKIGKISL